MKKFFYEKPDSEVFEVRIEENILSGEPIKPWEPDEDPLE